MDVGPFQASIDQARKELAIVVAQLALMDQLNKRRATLETFIAAAEDVIRAGDSGLAVIGGLTSAGEVFRSRPEDTPLSDQKVWEMVQLVMHLRRKPMTAEEILVELEHQHFKIGGQHRRETVRGADVLRKLDVFERVGRGMFALKEWSEELKHSRDDQDLLLNDEQ